ncbi:NaeI family type II restriction endonuclease [Hyphomicrobium sp.]|uniref:NaeI family type II restriction endonuclease n=1 Tax=Hyphomicrobium sp. TaxID=82 RepID=UPI002D798637|nr:NaeI family type II restriction endonuclease [Hyphomicrobium sp.]HET6390762.1 NaeI family type II restriction endonuclease [Hyphomicrobium sp.]
MRSDGSRITESHPDYRILSQIRHGVISRLAGRQDLGVALPGLIKDAVDFVLDPVRTGRTQLADLDRVEKTFIGLKIEHYLRDLLGAPRGLRRDMMIDGIEVDIKNTIGSTWMIPPETYRAEEPCLLIATAKFDGRCWLGLLVARDAYLNRPNRDGKRSVSEEGRRHIMWLVKGVPYPKSRWEGIDMVRFRELRGLNGGNKRAALFFQENLNRVVHRSVLQALLHDQLDYMRRLRGDGRYKGARELLAEHGIMLWCGAWADVRAKEGFSKLSADEWIALPEHY